MREIENQLPNFLSIGTARGWDFAGRSDGPKPPMPDQPIVIDLTLQCNFPITQAMEAHERRSRAMENRLMRRLRPHMPKRMFQRLRGRLKAKRRARS